MNTLHDDTIAQSHDTTCQNVAMCVDGDRPTDACTDDSQSSRVESCKGIGATPFLICKLIGWDHSLGVPLPPNGWGGARANSGGKREGAGRKRVERAPPAVATGPRWFVVETQYKAESIAIRSLLESGFRVYYPMTRVENAIVPMFTGYVFVEFDRMSDDWVPILEMAGVKDLITTAPHRDPKLRQIVPRRPIAAPLMLVEDLMSREEDRLNLGTVGSAVAPVDAMEPLSPGAEVVILTGPMSSFQAVVVSCDGITTHILASLFGRSVPMVMQRFEVRLHVVAL